MGIRDHMGEYDHVRCATCGVPWLKHDARQCPWRHEHRPTADIAAQTLEQIIPLLIAPELVKQEESPPAFLLPRVG